MITGLEWYEHQIKEKKKQLVRHEELTAIYKGKEEEETFRQLAYDDQRYLALLKFGRENWMWHKDGRDVEIGWCADK